MKTLIVHARIISPDMLLHQIVKATSWSQARSLGLDGFGKLEPGFHADLVTLVAGEVR
jgi:dihydroorotase-like cyclic amidohydrolase